MFCFFSLSSLPIFIILFYIKKYSLLEFKNTSYSLIHIIYFVLFCFVHFRITFKQYESCTICLVFFIFFYVWYSYYMTSNNVAQHSMIIVLNNAVIHQCCVVFLLLIIHLSLFVLLLFSLVHNFQVLIWLIVWCLLCWINSKTFS